MSCNLNVLGRGARVSSKRTNLDKSGEGEAVFGRKSLIIPLAGYNVYIELGCIRNDVHLHSPRTENKKEMI